MAEVLNRLGLLYTQNQMDAVQQIKQFSRLLSAYGILRVYASYNGSGDSGDIDDMTAVMQPSQNEADAEWRKSDVPPEDRPKPRETHVDLKKWLEKEVFDKPTALITRKMYKEFEDNVFSLLPGGWEINDGSFGEIIVSVSEEKIQIEHNERHVEISSETFSYE